MGCTDVTIAGRAVLTVIIYSPRKNVVRLLNSGVGRCLLYLVEQSIRFNFPLRYCSTSFIKLRFNRYPVGSLVLGCIGS